MALCVLALVQLGKIVFDDVDQNDPPKWLIAIPISLWIVCLAALDFMFYANTTCVKKRVFYNLDTTLKRWWVGGHCCASIIYSVLLFYWLWRMEVNENNKLG